MPTFSIGRPALGPTVVVGHDPLSANTSHVGDSAPIFVTQLMPGAVVPSAVDAVAAAIELLGKVDEEAEEEQPETDNILDMDTDWTTGDDDLHAETLDGSSSDARVAAVQTVEARVSTIVIDPDSMATAAQTSASSASVANARSILPPALVLLEGAIYIIGQSEAAETEAQAAAADHAAGVAQARDEIGNILEIEQDWTTDDPYAEAQDGSSSAAAAISAASSQWSGDTLDFVAMDGIELSPTIDLLEQGGVLAIDVLETFTLAETDFAALDRLEPLTGMTFQDEIS